MMGPWISLPFPVPFSEWVTSAETYWSTLAKRPSPNGRKVVLIFGIDQLFVGAFDFLLLGRFR
jgi:hypothetical protein